MRRQLLSIGFVLPLSALIGACGSSSTSPTGDTSISDVTSVDSGVRADNGSVDGEVRADSSANDSLSIADDGASTWWHPAPGLTWQWQLQGTLDTSYNVDVYDIDMFNSSASDIASLHAQGRKVICYVDTAYEPSRPDSATLLPFVGNEMVGWPGQYWLDIRNQTVVDTLLARLDLAQTKGCDGIEADDVDSMSNNPGFAITTQTQEDFIRTLASRSHALGMAFGLKNDLDQVSDLLSNVDFAVNESCGEYTECGSLLPFINANKAVFHCEYNQTAFSTVCGDSQYQKFSSILKSLDLTAAPRTACP